jgi:predicted thioesterase
VEHRRATPVGGIVEVSALAPLEPEGRRLTFIVRAHDADGNLIAHGEIDRVVVDLDQFLATITAD